MGRELLQGTVARGATVDFYTTTPEGELTAELHAWPNLRVVREEPHWSWNRWYSRKPFAAFITGTAARVRAYNRLVRRLLEEHRRDPYDCIFQLSQTELFDLRKYVKELPPIVVYPCVHAAGELRWHRRESAYARRSEPAAMHYLTRAYLRYRAIVQRRELRVPALVLGMSERFNTLIAADYDIDPGRLGVLYHPMVPPLEATAPRPSPEAVDAQRPLTLLFISRISVRKGVEQVIELSKRLDDLAGRVRIRVIGGRTMWSDYTLHLKDLNPRVATFLGSLPHARVFEELSAADALLVPSLYEPGGLVVGESLIRGVPVVASDAVGSAELVSGECCRSFPAGDVDALERTTRALLADLWADPNGIRACARDEARRHFDPQVIAGDLLTHLTRAAAASRSVGRARAGTAAVERPAVSASQ